MGSKLGGFIRSNDDAADDPVVMIDEVEPIDDKVIIDAFLQKSTNLAAAHRLVAESYQTYNNLLKAPSIISMVSLLAMSGFAEVVGTDVRNLVVLIISTVGAFFRYLEAMLNFGNKANDHLAAAESLSEFSESVLVMSRKRAISADTVTKILHKWHKLKCVHVPISYEQKASKAQRSMDKWLSDLKRKQHSASTRQSTNLCIKISENDISDKPVDHPHTHLPH